MAPHGNAGSRNRFLALFIVLLLIVATVVRPASQQTPGGQAASAQELLKSGAFKEAVAACDRALALDRNNAEILLTRGLANAALGQLEESVNDFTRAIRANGSLARPYYERANVEHRLKRENDALDDVNAYLKLDPRSYWGFDLRGLVYMTLGNYAAAARDFDQAIVLNGREGRLYADRSFARRRLQQYQEAVADADKAIALGDTVASAYNTRGLARTDAKDYAGALKDFDLAIAKDPKSATFVASRGFCLTNMGNLDAAERELARALSMDPKSAVAYRYRAELNEKCGNTAKAAADAAEAYRLEPSDIRIRELAARLAPASGARVGDVLETPARNDGRGVANPGKTTAPPWSDASGPAIDIPKTAPAAPIAPLLDINDLTVATYNGAVSAAMESMRLLYGNLTAEQEADFQKRWNPLFDSPTPEAIAYFNKLNPLLGQFLAVRASMAEACAAFDSARFESMMAAGLSDEAGTREALDIGYQHKVKLESLRTTLADVTAKIVALGNPPNPLEGHRTRRKAHTDAVNFLRNLAPATPVASPAKGTALYWVLKSLDTGGGKKTGSSSERYTLESTEGMAAGSYHSADKETTVNIAASVTWTPPARVMRELEVPDTVSARITQFDVTGPGATPNVKLAFENLASAAFYVSYTPDPYDASQLYWSYAATPAKPVSRTGAPRSLHLFGGDHSSTGNGKQTIAITIKSPGGTAWYKYNYEEKELTADQVAAIQAADAKAKIDLAKQQVDAADRQHAAQEEAELKTAALANVQANIAYFQGRATDIRNQIGSSPAASRDTLNWMRMVADANLQGEKDQLTSIQTGEFVHTRTEFDDYCLGRMLENDRALTLKLETDQRKISSYPRLIALLPKELQYDENKQTSERMQRAIEAGDFAQVDLIVKNLSDRVQAYWQTKAADQMEKAAWANLGVEMSENIKAGADYSLMGMSFFGGAGVYAAYAGATGYVAGGVVEGVKQAAAAYSMPAAMAVEAYNGYEKGGLSGAAYNVATQGAIFFVMHKLSAPLADSFGGGAASKKWPTIEQTINEARFKAQYAEGRSLIKVFQQRQARLAEVGTSGASREAILKARSEAEQAAMAIKTSYTAKMVLNQAAREGDTALMHAYMSHERQFMGRVRAAFETRMKNDGWSPQQYKEFRNAASVGKAGIDLDLGAVEPARWIAGPGKTQSPNPEYLQWRRNLVQNGQPKTPRELQEAGQKALESAYVEVLGRNPSEAFINFTTSGHPEAYKDLAWLGKKTFKVADVPNIDPNWARQAADVTGFKVMDLPRTHPSLNYYITLQEQCRGMVKDFDTKLEPLMKAASPSIKSHWTDVRAVMADFSTNKIGPVDADRRLRSLTGGQGIGEVQKQFSNTMEALVTLRAVPAKH